MFATESNGVDQLDARDDDQLLFDELGETRIEAQKRWEQLESAKKQVEALYARWETLEDGAG